ncbi:MAG: hypothetical protein ACI9KK_001006 [Ascidiaceihabitans sp.]|jgi:hypothetical protein
MKEILAVWTDLFVAFGVVLSTASDGSANQQVSRYGLLLNVPQIMTTTIPIEAGIRRVAGF